MDEDDPLRAAKGIGLGIVISVVFWLVLFWIAVKFGSLVVGG